MTKNTQAKVAASASTAAATEAVPLTPATGDQAPGELESLGIDTPDSTKEADPPTNPGETVMVRVLAAVTLGAARYQPDDVVDLVPAALAKQNAASVDANPDAVEYALDNGSPVKVFEAVE